MINNDTHIHTRPLEEVSYSISESLQGCTQGTRLAATLALAAATAAAGGRRAGVHGLGLRRSGVGKQCGVLQNLQPEQKGHDTADNRRELYQKRYLQYNFVKHLVDASLRLGTGLQEEHALGLGPVHGVLAGHLAGEVHLVAHEQLDHLLAAAHAVLLHLLQPHIQVLEGLFAGDVIDCETRHGVSTAEEGTDMPQTTYPILSPARLCNMSWSGCGISPALRCPK